MIKHLAIGALFALCACGTTQAVVPAAAPLPVTRPLPPVEQPVSSHVFKVELPRGRKAQAFVCTDELACLKKLTGFCENGYSGSEYLHGESERVVGVIFHCYTDEERAEMIAAAKQREEAVAAFEAAAKKAAEEAAKKPTKK